GVASQLLEIGALLIPDDQIAAPVKRLDVARHDVRHQSETLCSGPTGELHQITHVHVLVAVIEIEFPARQGIGHHQIDIAVLTLGRLARAWSADRPLRQRTGRECHRSRHAHEEKLENRAHVDLLLSDLCTVFESARESLSFRTHRPGVVSSASFRCLNHNPATRVIWPSMLPAHSALAPENLTTLAHFSVSSTMSLPNWAGAIGMGAPPRSAKRACRRGSASTAL